LKKLVYLAFNKPAGIITHSPQGDEQSIAEILKFNQEVYPLGRLDKDSHGLIILTNDGRMTDRLLNPVFEHEKEYEVEVAQSISENFIKQMERGVKLDRGYVTQKCKLTKLDDNTFSIILTEGKNRQIRRMCAALGYEVIDLRRVRIMNIELGNLKEGHYRIISGEEREELLGKLEL
jgi:23S rRNA pseudouridine2604 synthase